MYCSYHVKNAIQIGHFLIIRTPTERFLFCKICKRYRSIKFRVFYQKFNILFNERNLQ